MSAPPPVLGYAPPERDDLLQIAHAQRWVIFLILAQLGMFAGIYGMVATTDRSSWSGGGGGWMTLVPKLYGVAFTSLLFAGVFFAVRLGRVVFDRPLGTALGILTVIPVVGMLVLLIINARANRALTAAGIEVGLLGARMSQVPTTVVR